MDPQQQQAVNHLMGMGAGIMLFAVLFGVAVYAFITFLFWRVFVKAGLSGPLALLNLLYPVGPLICLCILAFSNWKVAPMVNPYIGATPPYGPPGGYPPNYPPSGYPPQGPSV